MTEKNRAKAPDPNGHEHVMIAMSGGVDSSIAVSLMREKGYTCVGATMELVPTEAATAPREQGQAISEEDMSPSACAARVAAELGIAHHTFDCREEFSNQVIAPFVRAYLSGITPNPCVRCNRHLKFDLLLAQARALGCGKIATGHYARVRKNEESGRYELLRGADPKKDQSYVLYVLTQEQLSRVEFPLGEYTKEQVREFARARGLTIADKGESQDICFIPDGDYGAFICRWVNAQEGNFPERETKGAGAEEQLPRGLLPGDFVDEEGNVLGRHRGYIRYTIGQRKGLGLSSTEPWYVTQIRTGTNEVVLGRREAARGRELIADDFNWVSIGTPTGAFMAEAKARYRHDTAVCEVTPLPDGRVRVVFEEPQWAITRGQAVVLYDGDRVLGGGTIVQA